MIPYKVHLDDWTVSLYATDDGRLTFTVANRAEPDDRMVQVVGEVRLRRYYLGQQCAGDLHPSPFPVAQPAVRPSLSKESILAAEGAG